MDDEWVIITSRNKAVFTVRPVWVTNGRKSAVIAMLGSSLRMLQFRLGMDGHFRSTKQGGLSDFVSHTMQFLVSYGTVFRLQKFNLKIAYCCIRRCSLVLLASSAVYALIRITHLAVRGIHILSSPKIKKENRVLLYTLMFARAFGIFCCFCLISYDIPGRSWYTYHIMWDRSWTSCGWFRITYLAVPGIIFSAYHRWSIMPTTFIHDIMTSAFFHSRAFCFRVKNIMWVISYHIPGRSWYTYHVMWDRWRTSRGWFRISYLADNSF